MLSNEEALDLFADILEPAAEIFSDKAISAALNNNEKPIKAIKIAIKNHKTALIEILARLDGKDPKDYHVGVLTLPLKAIELLNKPEVQSLFMSQAQKTDAASSGLATENIEDGVN